MVHPSYACLKLSTLCGRMAEHVRLLNSGSPGHPERYCPPAPLRQAPP